MLVTHIMQDADTRLGIALIFLLMIMGARWLYLSDSKYSDNHRDDDDYF
jgi:hypothetical protein